MRGIMRSEINGVLGEGGLITPRDADEDMPGENQQATTETTATTRLAVSRAAAAGEDKKKKHQDKRDR